MLYILVGKNPVQVFDTFAWAEWHSWMLQNGGTHVARNEFPAQKPLGKNKKSKRGPARLHTRSFKQINRWRESAVLVSTVFLCVDHAFMGSPVLFETMIFGGRYDEYQERYKTFDDALHGHERALRLI